MVLVLCASLAVLSAKLATVPLLLTALPAGRINRELLTPQLDNVCVSQAFFNLILLVLPAIIHA